NPLAIAAEPLEHDASVDQREERVIVTAPDVGAGVDPGAALANENVAGAHELASTPLHAQELRVAVATVARRTLSLLMSQVAPLRRARYGARIDSILNVVYGCW